MDKSSIPNSAVPDQATSPEEDATLLAIEALEARSVDPNPRPLNAPPREIPVPERPIAAPVTPKVIEPVITAPKPVVQPTPIVIQPVPKPPIAPVPAPAPVVAPKPKRHATPSEEMAEELAGAPASFGFQFFANQKPPRKPFIVVGIIVIVIGIGVAAYFTSR